MVIGRSHIEGASPRRRPSLTKICSTTAMSTLLDRVLHVPASLTQRARGPRSPSQERVIKDATNQKAFQSRPGFRGTLADLTAFVTIAIQTTAAMYRHQESRQPAKFGPWSHDWRAAGEDDEGEPLFDSDDDVIWDLTQARPPAEIEAEALRMGYVAPAERDDSSTGGSTVDLT